MTSTAPDILVPRRLVLITVADLGGLSGPAIHVLNLARHLGRLGHVITLVSPEPSAAMPVALGPAVTHRVLQQRRSAGMPAAALLPQLLACLKTVAVPDAVYMRASVATWPLVPYARRLWQRPIAVEYNAWFAADLMAMGRPTVVAKTAAWLQVREAHSADAIRVVTAGLKTLLVDRGVAPAKIRVIDNGTDLETFRPLDQLACRQAIGLPTDRALLGFAGNLWSALDFRTVFAAMRVLTETARVTDRELDLVVVGDGPGRAGFEDLARTMFGPMPPVRWLGAQSPETVNTLLNAVDVVLAPFTRARNSVTGLAPLKIRDCAGAGRPCVASRVAGIDQLEGEPWMFLADPEDPVAFALATRRALAADPVATRLAARTFAEQRFDWRLVAEQVAALALPQSAT